MQACGATLSVPDWFIGRGCGCVRRFLGCPIDILSMAETVELAREAMRSRQRLQHVALNVAKLVNMRLDPVLAADVASSDVVEHRRHGHCLGRAGAGSVRSSRASRASIC